MSDWLEQVSSKSANPGGMLNRGQRMFGGSKPYEDEAVGARAVQQVNEK